jgi:hypothetical protein
MGAAAVLLILILPAVRAADPALPGPLVITQVPVRAPVAGGEAPLDGSRLVLVAPGAPARVLTEGFSSAADPEVSFDGRRILFAGKKAAADPWCIYEMQADGSDARRVTCGPGSARRPVYLPTMHTLTPTATEEWVMTAFVGGRPGEVNEIGSGEARSLYACRLDGSALRRLTFNLSTDADPAVLPDGRIVYASWQRQSLDHGPQGRQVLLAANPDGTDAVPYVVDDEARARHTPAATAAGLLVFVESDDLAGDGSGHLASVSLHRPLHSRRVLAQDVEGLFHSPSPLPDGRILVSWRPATGGGDHGVYRLDPATGRREKLFDAPGWHDVQARLLAPRSVPDSRSSPVRDDDSTGKVYGIDVAISDLPPGALAPATAKKLRVLEGVPRRADDDAASPLAARRILGEVPLAEDGSFHVLVPADTPLQLQVLDADGLALRSGAWIWARPHFNQGCVGCHEDPERTPPNRFAKAIAAPAAELTLAPELRRTVDFRHDVRPIATARCLACHGSGGKPPYLGPGPADESPDAAYRNLLATYVRAGTARTSRVVWHLFGRNTSRPWDGEEAKREVHRMPDGSPPLSDEERRTIVEWIDMGAAWDAQPPPAAPVGAPAAGGVR